MINQTIIFSKNRACQLNLLLESIHKNGFSENNKISVIYHYTDNDYLKGYQILELMYKEINFIKQNDFQTDVINCIDGNIEYLTFMVDDDVIYRKLPPIETYISKIKEHNASCFSLRLGKNCRYSHPANIDYKLMNHQHITENIIKIDTCHQMNGDFRYPLSLDGHIFKMMDIVLLLNNIKFNNPNQLEARLQIFTQSIISKPILSFDVSHLVGVPVNIVNTSIHNRHSVKFNFPENVLNDKLINQNTKIDLDQFMKCCTDIIGPHQEIEYRFKPL